MPIDATCPHCLKTYRLKDELVGKTVKCSGAECRKPFLVTPSANGKSSAPAAAAPKPTDSVQAKIDAEKLAAELFADEGDVKQAEEKQIEVTCEVCEHKWSEPASKIGKNVICPDCKHRQRIPEPKKKAVDWRDATGGRRLAEKQPDVPADVQQTTGVSIKALQEAGAIPAPEVEPRSLKEKLAIVSVIVLTLAAIGAASWWLIRTRSDGKEDQIMAEAVKEIDAIKDDGPLPKGQPPLLRAVLNLSAGEYAIRKNEPKGLNDALKYFGEVRQQLGIAPRSFDRDAIYGELALASLNLSGTEDEVKAETRIGWSQQQAKFAPAGNTQRRFVQIELRQLLTTMLQSGVDLEMRQLTLRRLARELTKRGQTEVLFEIAKQGFADGEWPESQAQMLLESLKAGAAADKVKVQAEQIPLGGEFDPAPLTVPVLFKKLGMPLPPPPKVPAPPQGQQMDLRTRIVHAQLTGDVGVANAGDSSKAVERGIALLALAEAADDPNPALDAAAEHVKSIKPVALFRLVRVACEAKQPAKAEAFAKAIQDDGLREWAVSDALRAKWAAGKTAAPIADAPKPAAVANLRAGHGWGCVGFARHNAAQGGGSAAAKEYDGWNGGELKGFGYAGLALGLQDRK